MLGRGHSPTSRRWPVLAGAVAAALVLSTVAVVVVATRARTPAEQAATTRPPSPSIITAPVSDKALQRSDLLTGTIGRQSTAAVHISLAARDGIDRLVVTSLNVHAGSVVHDGSVIETISGRPVIALEGRIPMYRDLHVGMSGPDVTQAQSALSALGLNVGATGTYDKRTAYAVARLYSGAGYLPPGVTATLPAAARTRAAATTTLLSGEIAFVSGLPGVVSQIAAGVGAEVTGSLMTVSSGGWQLTAAVTAQDEQDLSSIRAGAAAQGQGGPAAGRTATFTGLHARAPATGSPGDSGGAVTEAVFTLPALPAPAAGQTQSVLLVLARSPRGALTVPAAAIWTAADGTTRVTVMHGSVRQQITVTVVFTAQGSSSVTAAGLLHAGDQVLLGAADSTSGGP